MGRITAVAMAALTGALTGMDMRRFMAAMGIPVTVALLMSALDITAVAIGMAGGMVVDRPGRHLARHLEDARPAGRGLEGAVCRRAGRGRVPDPEARRGRRQCRVVMPPAGRRRIRSKINLTMGCGA